MATETDKQTIPEGYAVEGYYFDKREEICQCALTLGQVDTRGNGWPKPPEGPGWRPVMMQVAPNGRTAFIMWERVLTKTEPETK